MKPKEPFTADIILMKDVGSVVDLICQKLRQDVIFSLKRFGAVIGISGGIDSSVCLALAAKALGSDSVLGLILPEKDSSPESKTLAMQLAGQLKVKVVEENVTGALEGFQCYERRDEAIRRIFPEYSSNTHKMKIGVKQTSLYSGLPPVFHLMIIDDKGNQKENILPVKEYLQIVAASNFKQRVRMSMLYHYAELNHFAVIGTPNKHEHNQGFFVKYGDGAADVMPIVPLYKTQVYQIAEYLDIPKEIIERAPTTDTYSADQTQEEFFYQLPFETMDRYWYGFENGYSAQEVADVMGETEEHVKSLFQSFERKMKTTEYLRLSPVKYQVHDMFKAG
jgi:NAD+ synthase